MGDNNDAILIFAVGEAAVSALDVRRCLSDTIRILLLRLLRFWLVHCRKICTCPSAVWDVMIRVSPEDIDGLALDEVEIHAQIEVKGTRGFME